MKTEQERIKAKAEDIKKALEICTDIYAPCNGCPYETCANCDNTLHTDALKLINEQEKEIERLKAENGQSSKSRILGNKATVVFIDDVLSEPSADCKDIEKYAKQFRNRIISINEKEIKQAKIDVLNELKERTYRDSVYYPEVKYEHKYVNMDDIDQMIEELEK